MMMGLWFETMVSQRLDWESGACFAMRERGFAARSLQVEYQRKGEHMFQFVAQIFVGLLVGALDNLAIPNGKPTGVITTSLIGLTGSMVATLLGRFLFVAHGIMGWVVSLAGSVAALFFYQMMIRRRLASLPQEYFLPTDQD
jgi:uncharacterized membrane protein YeaQ/YmgE (transglycosylase-associated protein family)